MVWIRIFVALVAAYAVFVFGPALVAYLTIFRGRSGSGVDALTAPGAQLAPYADRLRTAYTRLCEREKTRVTTTAKDGVPLSADWYDLGMPKTAIFVHGYRTDPYVNFSVQGEAFLRHGYNLLLIRQRGHELGSRVRCTLGMIEGSDALAWNEWALSKPGVSETVLYGISMGAAAVAYASDRVDRAHTHALILDCGFRSPYEQVRLDCVRRHIPPFLMMPLIRLFAKLFLKIDIRERNDAHLKKSAVPCFFLHGEKDLTVPYETGRALYDVCSGKKAFFAAKDAGHTESFLSDPEQAENEIFTFLGEEQNAAQ